MKNLAARLRAYGGPDQIEVVETEMPVARAGEVRVRVLASSVQFTDTVIRRHRYPHAGVHPPFVLGYDVVGEIDQVGEGVRGLAIGDRVADMTVTGSNTRYRTLRANRVTLVPPGVDPAQAATLVLSWTTAYQLLHRVARVRAGQSALVQGAAGAVGEALVVLGRLADLELWGTGRPRDLRRVRELGATPVDAEHDYSHVLPGGFDLVFDGIAENGYRRSWRALGPDGRLCAYGFSAGVDRSLLAIGWWIARLYMWSLGSRKRAGFYSINLMRLLHPAWFKEDLATLFALLEAGMIRPAVGARIGFDGIVDAHRRLDEMRASGKIVLCP